MISVHEEVEQALAQGRPVVALESAVITHGLPRGPVHAQPSFVGDSWDGGSPANLALGRAMREAVRKKGATPATIAVIDGVLKIGVSDGDLERLATTSEARKLSSRDLATAIEQKAMGGTTVAATLRSCALAKPNPIRVLATGGIGGVHRGWPQHPDVSVDLLELSRSPVCVVCSGAKSILDLPLTLEALETLGIPVVGYRVDQFAAFVLGAEESLKTSSRVDSPSEAAGVCCRHWGTLAQSGAVLVCQALPTDLAVDRSRYAGALEQAEREVGPFEGAAATPALLSRVIELTNGAALHSNLALLLANASLAAEVAGHLAQPVGES